MFLDNSRYARTKQVDVRVKDGRTVKAVSLRRLPTVTVDPAIVMGNDRLDIMAQRRYKDPMMFWHIADANTELEANKLVEKPSRVIKAPAR